MEDKKINSNTNERLGRLQGEVVCKTKIPGCKVVKESEDENAHWDSIWKINNEYILVEYKRRKNSSNLYNGEPILEVQKNKWLQKIKEEFPKISDIYYVNFYTDNIYKIHNTTNINKENTPTNKFLCPETTDFGRVKMVLKDCFVLPKDGIYEGQIITQKTIN